MKVTVIGVVPPCPRCKHMYDLAEGAAEELGVEVAMDWRGAWTGKAQKYGKVGTAHHIAEWTGMEMDWSKIREIISEEQSQELDVFLMPCTRKAEEKGWLMTPVLLIDDEVAFSGYVPKKEDIKEALKKAAQQQVGIGGQVYTFHICEMCRPDPVSFRGSGQGSSFPFHRKASGEFSNFPPQRTRTAFHL